MVWLTLVLPFSGCLNGGVGKGQFEAVGVHVDGSLLIGIGVASALYGLGDIYLVGRLPAAGPGSEDLDRLLGSVLRAWDDSFNTILRLGFASSIRKERARRGSRGESTANLEGFAELTDDALQENSSAGRTRPGASR